MCYGKHCADQRWHKSHGTPHIWPIKGGLGATTHPNVGHALSVATFQTQHKFGAQSSTFLDDKTAPVAQENNFKMES